MGPVQKNQSTSGQAKESTILGPKGAKKVEVAQKNCWSTYLEKNPAMQKWAIANPAQAEQNKKRFRSQVTARPCRTSMATCCAQSAAARSV